MRDILFFPLTAALCAGLIYLALAPFQDRPPSGAMSGGAIDADRSRIVVQDADLYRFVAAGPGDIEIVDGPPTIARITLQEGQAVGLPQRGVHLPLAADLERSWAERRLKITITARAAAEGGASAMEARYAVGFRDESDWTPFDITLAFEDYSFERTLPPTNQELSFDYLGVRPVVPEKQRSVEVSRIVFEIVG